MPRIRWYGPTLLLLLAPGVGDGPWAQAVGEVYGMKEQTGG